MLFMHGPLSQGNSEAVQIVKKAGVGTVADYNDVSEIKHKIETLIDEYLQKGRIEITADEDEINKYDGRKLTGELAEIFNKIGS